jgi:hypothetical protein
MKYLSVVLISGLVLLNVCGCTTSGVDEAALKSITFAVVNQFPEHPNYLKEKTLTAMQQNSAIESLAVKKQLTQVVQKFLAAKGYRVIEAESKAALKDGRADMVIEIVPLQISQKEGTFGYGFSDRKFLLGLINTKPQSYVALHLTLSRKNSMRVITTSKEERFSDIGVDTMPGEWNELSEKEKKRFEENLQANMAKAVDLLLSQLKL